MLVFKKSKSFGGRPTTFTRKEDECILEAVRIHEKKWEIIAKNYTINLNHRTTEQIKDIFRILEPWVGHQTLDFIKKLAIL